MARPPLPPGTYGNIKAKQLPTGVWEARCTYRDLAGGTSQPSARAATEAAAKNALRKRMSDIVAENLAGELSPETTVAEIWEFYIAEIQREADKRVRSPQTPRLYKSWWSNHIRPAVGALRCREAEKRIRQWDQLIQGVHDKHSYDSAKTVRTVASGLCGFAVRHGAMTLNPIRSVSRLARAPGEAKEVVALDDNQRAEVLERLETYAGEKERDSKGRRLGKRVLVWRDLPELGVAMLATGVRIGEVLAFGEDSVVRLDGGATAVDVDHHIVREPGKGLLRLPGRKGGAPALRLILPGWAVPMFRRRKLAATAGGPLFASATGTWLDPSNTGGRLKAALEETSLAWVTPHVFRKTVFDDLDQAGLSLSEGANQLGNTVAVAEKHYRSKRPTNQRAAEALDRRAPRRKTAGGG